MKLPFDVKRVEIVARPSMLRFLVDPQLVFFADIHRPFSYRDHSPFFAGRGHSGEATSAVVGQGLSGRFGDPRPESVSACCEFVSTLIWVMGGAFGKHIALILRLPSLPRRGGSGRLWAGDGVVLSS